MSHTTDQDPQPADDDGVLSLAFATALKALVGKPVLWHISDPQSGVAIDLGERVERARAISNPHLTEEQRRYEGDSYVFITSTWRLAAPDELMPERGETDQRAWWDEQLLLIVGRVITAAATTPDRLELSLRFDNGVCLVADLAESQDHQNYTVTVRPDFWTVSAGGRLSHELH